MFDYQKMVVYSSHRREQLMYEAETHRLLKTPHSNQWLIYLGNFLVKVGTQLQAQTAERIASANAESFTEPLTTFAESR